MYVCIIKIHVPRAHEVKNQRVIAKRTSQIMKYGQDVIIQKRILTSSYCALLQPKAVGTIFGLGRGGGKKNLLAAQKNFLITLSFKWIQFC